MKYRIVNRVINADQIVQVNYSPECGDIVSQCDIILTSVNALELDKVATSDMVTLRDSSADSFWQVYSSDALDVLKVSEWK